jgi:hypothetical protein
MKAGNLVKHRSKDGFGTVIDIDGMRHNLPIVIVMWADQRGIKYEPVNELKVFDESR